MFVARTEAATGRKIILSNKRQSSPVARGSRFLRVVFWSAVLVVAYLAVTPQDIALPGYSIDKLGHFLAFLTLSFLLHLSYGTHSLLTAGGLLAYGVGIELVQSLLPYRDFSLLDILADCAGILAFLLIRLAAVRMTR